MQSIPFHENINYTEVITTRGQTKEYTLNDGTRITLNSQSKLSIPSNYNEKERSVKITGEAFFDVTPNQEKPFTVTGKEMLIKVLGTFLYQNAFLHDDMGMAAATGVLIFVITVTVSVIQLKVSKSGQV